MRRGLVECPRWPPLRTQVGSLKCALGSIRARRCRGAAARHFAPACAFHLCGLLCFSIGSVENPMITHYSYPELFGVADNNGYGLKVFAFLRLNGMPFKHEHVFDASAAPRGQLPYIVDDDETIGDSDTII